MVRIVFQMKSCQNGPKIPTNLRAVEKLSRLLLVYFLAQALFLVFHLLLSHFFFFFFFFVQHTYCCHFIVYFQDQELQAKFSSMLNINPRSLTLRFRKRTNNNKLKPMFFVFAGHLSAALADVVVTHTPPLGILDVIKTTGSEHSARFHCSSYLLRVGRLVDSQLSCVGRGLTSYYAKHKATVMLNGVLSRW